MRSNLNRCTFFVLSLVFSSLGQAAMDVTIVNTSNRLAQAIVNGFECDSSETCYISPNTSARISYDIMASLCQNSEEECIVELKVAELRSPVGSAAYRMNDGIVYVNGVKWRGYSARMLANDVIEVYQDNAISSK